MSENLWMVSRIKGPKDCLNLHGNIFVIFFDHSEGKPATEILRLFVNLLTPDEKYSLSVNTGV